MGAAGLPGAGGDGAKKNGRVSRFDQTSDPFSERKRRKKSRWGGGEEDKTFIPGMPTMLPAGLNKDQEEAYLRKLRSSNFFSQARSMSGHLFQVIIHASWEDR